jgi:integrase
MPRHRHSVHRIMGWSNSAMAMRYQHITAQVRVDIAERVDGLLWESEDDRGDDDGAAGVLVHA